MKIELGEIQKHGGTAESPRATGVRFETGVGLSMGAGDATGIGLMRRCLEIVAGSVFLTALAMAQPATTEGIPVTDPVVIAKCGSCHTRDANGMMQRVSFARSTPEGWQATLRRAILDNNVALTPVEARSIVRYLSINHGLSPQEAQFPMYDAERRVRDESVSPDANRVDPTGELREACIKCHPLARTMVWRRTAADWKQFTVSHGTRYKFQASDELVALLAKTAPFQTPEWTAWSKRANPGDLSGRWLVKAFAKGRGYYFGEMQVQAGANPDELTSRMELRSVNDGSSLVRTGRSAVFGGYAWRGSSSGSEARPGAPGVYDLFSDARDVMWFSADQRSGNGRSFWGQYQEFGLDLSFQRPPAEGTPYVMGVDRPSLKAATQTNRVRVLGVNFPAMVKASDLSFGPGVTVRRVVSVETTKKPNEVVAEVDVAANATPGRRDVAVGRASARGAIAIYDHIDYMLVTPETSVAGFGDKTRQRGFQQFEAIGFHRGPDGKRRTDDDIELGPIEVDWSLKVFYESADKSTAFLGEMTPGGLFTPATESPNNNWDVWVIATAKSEKDPNGKLLTGRGYLVVTVPFYTFGGRRYVRDLERWVDDGPAN
jgi:quinohemoprotein amine dehydrogenase